jgi:NAD+ synthase (glutamine-hydrolysing)
MKIALAQLNYHVGNIEYNTQKIIAAIEDAKNQKADIVVFAELALCGYPPLDLLEFDEFISNCENAILTIARACNNITAIVGAPSRNNKKFGKALYNSAFVLSNGKIIDIYHKALLPNYDVFDEFRYFEPAVNFQCLNINQTKIALTICEDLWNIGEKPMYPFSPMDTLIKEQPQLIINIAASPFSVTHHQERLKILKENSLKYQLPIAYVNHCGTQTELIFDGGSLILNCNGEVCEQLPFFDEAIRIIDTNNLPSSNNSYTPNKTELLYKALVSGIKDYFQKMNFKKAILGLSGGVDSALVLVLAVEALGSENVKAILLPSQFSSEHSVSDAKNLAENLNCPYEIIPISSAYKSVEEILQPYFKNLPFNIAEENIQSRLRGLILMALSNKFGYILLNTSNKSELAVGYGTLYGDMTGGLSVIGDLYKTEVYELCQYINREKEIIPKNILTKAPSAELRPNQKDSDTLPEYNVLDAILKMYIEERLGPEKIIEKGFDVATSKKVIQLVNNAEYKRKQFCPILRVSGKAFGLGRRMPIVAKYF